ncbi:G-protein coupled receptor Mth2-like [Neodiprion virginianus]|uniref:G-protein coupled receptor Mth2-like n=1 Tax=Neodiprion virginianus TaxID=2961670 RepID=UPI001EE6A82B|nr:G-protein coupled receptor Mth2-like [Neodiprion virginianus]
MLVPTCLLVVILTLIRPSVEINGNGTELPLPENNVADFNGSESANRSRHILLPIFCCHPGMVRLPGRCESNNDAPLILVKIGELTNELGVEVDIPNHKHHLVTHDPCIADWTRSSIVDFKAGSLWSHEKYCLLWDPKKANFVAKVCYTWVLVTDWDKLCTSIAGFTMPIIFIGYSVVPELKTPHGLIFRCYVATYALAYVGMMGAVLTYELPEYPVFFTIFAELVRFSGFSVISWLNVINFEMWRSFRSLNTLQMRERTRKKFMCYAIYAWLGPILMVAVVNEASTKIPVTYDDPGVAAFKHWTSVGIIFAGSLCNIFLYSMTARVLNKFKKDTRPLTDLSNEHYAARRQWFKLHMKLLVLTGAHSTVWIVWYTWPTAWLTRVFSLAEAIQSGFLLHIFLWNDRVKRYASKLFHQVLCFVAGPNK